MHKVYVSLESRDSNIELTGSLNNNTLELKQTAVNTLLFYCFLLLLSDLILSFTSRLPQFGDHFKVSVVNLGSLSFFGRTPFLRSCGYGNAIVIYPEYNWMAVLYFLFLRILVQLKGGNVSDLQGVPPPF